MTGAFWACLLFGFVCFLNLLAFLCCLIFRTCLLFYQNCLFFLSVFVFPLLQINLVHSGVKQYASSEKSFDHKEFLPYAKNVKEFEEFLFFKLQGGQKSFQHKNSSVPPKDVCDVPQFSFGGVKKIFVSE
jgi:hypothetical protein